MPTAIAISGSQTELPGLQVLHCSCRPQSQAAGMAQEWQRQEFFHLLIASLNLGTGKHCAVITQSSGGTVRLRRWPAQPRGLGRCGASLCHPVCPLEPCPAAAAAAAGAGRRRSLAAPGTTCGAERRWAAARAAGCRRSPRHTPQTVGRVGGGEGRGGSLYSAVGMDALPAVVLLLPMPKPSRNNYHKVGTTLSSREWRGLLGVQGHGGALGRGAGPSCQTPPLTFMPKPSAHSKLSMRLQYMMPLRREGEDKGRGSPTCRTTRRRGGKRQGGESPPAQPLRQRVHSRHPPRHPLPAWTPHLRSYPLSTTLRTSAM